MARKEHETNIYKISDIQEAYHCSQSEAIEARKLLFYIRNNIEELEDVLVEDTQESLLRFCMNYAKQKHKKKNVEQA